MLNLSIQTADNGYIVQYMNEQDVPAITIFEQKENELEVEAMVGLLSFVRDYLGMAGSRYSAQRIYIEVKPGDKYEESTL